MNWILNIFKQGSVTLQDKPEKTDITTTDGSNSGFKVDIDKYYEDPNNYHELEKISKLLDSLYDGDDLKDTNKVDVG